MKISHLKELLGMFGDETEIHIQTTPDDYTQPLTTKAIKLVSIKQDGVSIQENILVLTAFIPQKASK